MLADTTAEILPLDGEFSRVPSRAHGGGAKRGVDRYIDIAVAVQPVP
jgi:hypothetical protein